MQNIPITVKIQRGFKLSIRSKARQLNLVGEKVTLVVYCEFMFYMYGPMFSFTYLENISKTSIIMNGQWKMVEDWHSELIISTDISILQLLTNYLGTTTLIILLLWHCDNSARAWWWWCVEEYGCLSLLVTRPRYIWSHTDVRLCARISRDGHWLVPCPVCVDHFTWIYNFFF